MNTYRTFPHKQVRWYFISSTRPLGFAGSGKLHIGEFGKFQYSYSITLDNTNGQTLQHLSSKAKKEFYDCGGTICPTATYEAFVDHYGEFDYADKWIQAAFDGSRAVLGERKFDFSALDVEGRSSKSLLGRMDLWAGSVLHFGFSYCVLHFTILSYPRPFYSLLIKYQTLFDSVPWY